MKRVSILLFCAILIFAFPLPAAGREAVFRTSFNSGDIPSIDQALVSDFIGIQLADEMTVGLLRQDEATGSIEAGMATDWELSDDRLLIRLNLLKGVPWVRYDAASGEVEEVKKLRRRRPNRHGSGFRLWNRADAAARYRFALRVSGQSDRVRRGRVS